MRFCSGFPLSFMANNVQAGVWSDRKPDRPENGRTDDCTDKQDQHIEDKQIKD